MDAVAAKKGLTDRLKAPKAGFDWNRNSKANVEHIGDHGITPEEFEDAFLDPKRVAIDAHSGHKGFEAKRKMER